MDAAEKYIEKHYKELEAALGAKEINAALRREGDAILEEQMNHIGSQFNIYKKLLAALKTPAEQKSKKAVKLPKIQNEYTRERLEKTIELFGAERVYKATQRKQAEIASYYINLELSDIITKIPLKELKTLFKSAYKKGNEAWAFDYKKIKETKLRTCFKKVADNYGADFVLAEENSLMNRAIRDKIQTIMWFYHGPGESLKAYSNACDKIKIREKHRKTEKQI